MTDQFVDQMNYAVLQDLAGKMQPQAIGHALLDCSLHVDLATSASADNAQIRVMDDAGDVLCTQVTGLEQPPRRRRSRRTSR